MTPRKIDLGKFTLPDLEHPDRIDWRVIHLQVDPRDKVGYLAITLRRKPDGRSHEEIFASRIFMAQIESLVDRCFHPARHRFPPFEMRNAPARGFGASPGHSPTSHVTLEDEFLFGLSQISHHDLRRIETTAREVAASEARKRSRA